MGKSQIGHKTEETETMPPSAAIDFVKRQTSSKSKKGPVDDDDSVNETEKQVNDSDRTIDQRKMKPVYQPFSTRLRLDLKRRLKRLSHYREDIGHETQSVTQFVEEALLEWLEHQEEPPTA